MNTKPNSLLDLVETFGENRIYLIVRLSKAETEAEFDVCLEELIEATIKEMEQRANYLTEDKEDKISCYLAMGLNFPSVLRVTQETHSNGHVDITIEGAGIVQPFLRLGEAKIYRTYSYHLGGMEQLINRYSTGRVNTGFIFVYVKKEGVKEIMEDLMNKLDSNKSFSQIGKSQAHSKIKWSYNTKHIHSSGEELRVLHLGINLYRQQSS